MQKKQLMFGNYKYNVYFCTRNYCMTLRPFCITFHDCTFRAFSSAGSEHLPYKQRVGGSNPSTPTKGKDKKQTLQNVDFVGFVFLSNQKVGKNKSSCVIRIIPKRIQE